MAHQWLLEHRHCLHILATHYPASSWTNRGSIFNDVFGLSLSDAKVRDEYGGHKNGRRNAPSGIPPTRSVMWNDHVCRDEFNLPGLYNQQQAQDRQQMLQRIQASIGNLSLSNEDGLSGINMLSGRVRADTNVMHLAAAAAPAANTAAAPASASTALAGQNAPSSSSAAATNAATPAQGGRAWYHTQDISKEGGRFVYRPVAGLSYAVNPTTTWPRPVEFSSTITRTVLVCDQATCLVCRHGRAPQDD